MSKNNNIVYINHRVRDKRRKINIFDKVHQIKTDIKALLPEIEEDRLLPIFSHLRAFYEGKLHYGRRNVPENRQRKRELTNAEKIIYDYLLKNNLNPSTTYRWLLACRVPSDIKYKLERGEISYKKAIQIAGNRLRVKESNTGLLMIEEITNIIRSL